VLKDKTICVLGAGRSGQAAAALALRLGARARLVDQNPNATPVDGVECVYGEVGEGAFAADTIVVSPGIAAEGDLVSRARAACADVVGELGFAARFVPEGAKIAAITGTNGKSTVTAFTAQLLEAAGLRTFAGGNLGTPLSDAVAGGPEDGWEVAAVEVSSYQLELPGDFAPSAAAVLNVTPDHLARHKTLEVYARTKCRIFDRLPPDGVAAIPAGEPLLARLAADRPGRRCELGGLPGVLVRGDTATLEDGEVDLSGMTVPGAINRWNAGVACLLARGLGAPLEALDPSVLRGLPHRMEAVVTSAGVQWVNDSKATNVEATLAALAGLARPAVVLLGGFPKPGSRYQTLMDPLKARARAVVCFGEAGPRIAESVRGAAPVHEAFNLNEACELAASLARPGDMVLLSPACSSFDAFRNFEHRGEVFRELAIARTVES